MEDLSRAVDVSSLPGFLVRKRGQEGRGGAQFLYPLQGDDQQRVMSLAALRSLNWTMLWFSQPFKLVSFSLPLTTGFVVNGPPAPLCLETLDHLGYPERFNLPPARHRIFHLSFLLSGRHPLSCVLFGRRRLARKFLSATGGRSRILYPVQCNALLTLSAKLMKAETYLSLSA